MKHMEYIRHRYNVPAYRGRRVRFADQEGVIVAARGGYIKVRLDIGPKRPLKLHPTWNVEYYL